MWIAKYVGWRNAKLVGVVQQHQAAQAGRTTECLEEGVRCQDHQVAPSFLPKGRRAICRIFTQRPASMHPVRL